jgi:outer membrane biogenesis lipoprotein LolB
MKKMIVSLGLLLAACGGITSTEQVQLRAANDLRCDAAQVQTTQVDAKTIRANGCGQERTYVEDCQGDSVRCNWRSHGDNTAGAPPAAPAQ